MKKVNLFLLLMLPLLFSFTTSNYNKEAAKENIFKNNSDEEFLKRITNQVEAAGKALEYLDRVNTNQNYSAIVTVNRNEKDKFGNSIIISLVEEELLFSGNCKVCGVSSAYSCLKKINKDKSLGNEFTVKVKREGDCVNLSW